MEEDAMKKLEGVTMFAGTGQVFARLFANREVVLTVAEARALARGLREAASEADAAAKAATQERARRAARRRLVHA
jgi:hypothetical protein